MAIPFNLNFKDKGLMTNLRLTRAIWKFQAIAGGVFSYVQYNQFYENMVSTNTSFTQTYNFGFKTNFYREKFLEFEIGYNRTINSYEQGQTNPKFYTDSPYASIEVSFLKGFVFEADYSYAEYSNKTKSLNTYNFMNASLRYQKHNSQWEYSLNATNLLNTSSFNTDSANEFFISSNQYYIQPRYLILGVKYNL
ncbi:hypothetical protein MWU59_04490 [Flavobacteriaceae bacterium F08102]|nr:hypothetical protein [Flavobacteriaceae bacterium F08102]